jgi:putative CocE/NonD family hydrolase
VALVGLSISSPPLFALAAEPPPAVRVEGLVNVTGAVDLYSLFYPGGALQLHWALPWMHLIGAKGSGWKTRRWQDLFQAPPADVPAAEGFDRGFWLDVLGHPEPDDFWRALDASEWLPRVAVPTLSVSGWHDFMLGHTLRAYAGLPAGGDHSLIVGAWDHASCLGAQDASSNGSSRDMVGVLSGWLASVLKGEAPQGAPRRRKAAVLLQVMDDAPEERWIAPERFPPFPTQVESWYLASDGGANALSGDGRLTRTPRERPGRDVYTYDPRSPVPTLGGALWPFPAGGLQPGRIDQTPVEQRDDVLVYTSPPLSSDLHLVGPVEADIWASSSAPITDFTAKLVEVDREEKAWVLQEGIVRVRFPGGSAPQEAADGGQPRRLHIDLAATACRVPAGHRLRIEISSSNFPKYDRGLNTLDPPRDYASLPTALQTVFYGGDMASCLKLRTMSARAARRARAEPPGTIPIGRLARLYRRTRAACLESISAQFARPTGLMGRLAGMVLATANEPINAWTLTLLDVAPHHRVLEIGFGPGVAIQKLSRVVAAGHVTGVDHSELMVRQARRRNARAIRAGRVDLRCGTVSALDDPPGSFDRIFAVNSVQLWPDPVDTMRRLKALLRPGGLIALTFHPRFARDEKMVRDAGRAIATNAAAAGLREVRVELKSFTPVPAVCVLAGNAQAAGASAGGTP